MPTADSPAAPRPVPQQTSLSGPGPRLPQPPAPRPEQPEPGEGPEDAERYAVLGED